MAIKKYNFCKKCPNGCCKERAKDSLKELWKKICESKRVDIEMFGYDAHISFADLENIFENENKDD